MKAAGLEAPFAVRAFGCPASPSCSPGSEKKKEMWFKGRVAVSEVARLYCHRVLPLLASSSCSSRALFSDT